MTKKHQSAFTMLELLFTVSIVSILAVVGFASMGKLREKGEMTRELSGARNLLVAYQLYAQENNNRLMPGYKDESGIENFEGQALHSPISARYPWRLAPFIGKVEGTLVYNGNEKYLTASNSDYLVSVRPNLGINATFVGGHYGNSSLLRPNPRVEEKIGRWYVSYLGEASNASNLIVFASARGPGSEEGESATGYFEVQPPKALGNVWSEEAFEEESPPSSHGFVDFRWNGKAVAAMFDGSARMLNEEEMRDMRLWSDGAAEEDDPDYTITY